MSNAVERSRPTITAQLPLPHMWICERAVSVKKAGSVCRLERREVRGCGNMVTNSEQNESFEHF